MTIESATVAPKEKQHWYYGIRYTHPVGVIAAMADVSVRTMKDVLKLQGLGYQGRINEGWTMAQCFADAGLAHPRRAAPKVDDLDDAEYEIKRLRGMLLDLGVDPDG